MVSELWIDCLQFLPGASEVPVDDIPRINAIVVQATKSMLLRRRDSDGHGIQSIAVTFYLRDFDHVVIGQIVGRALAKNEVKTAEFTIWMEKDGGELEEDDRVDYAKTFKLFVDACPNTFAGLTYLMIENLRFGEELDVWNVFSTCARLQNLHMKNCDCDSGVPITLRVEHTQLTQLTVAYCGFEKLEITRLPKLKELTFEGWISFQDPISFGTVPLLEVVNLSNTCLSWHEMVKLSEFIRQTSVHNLVLEFKSEKIWIQPEVPTSRLTSVFRKLRLLQLLTLPEGFDLEWTLFFLEAAPSLEELHLVVWDHACNMEMDEETRRVKSYSEEKGVEPGWTAGAFVHRSLTRLGIIGFQSQDYLVRYVKRVMEVAVNLEDVLLFGRVACEECKDEVRSQFRYPRSNKQRWSVRNRIAEGTGSVAVIRFSPALGPLILDI